MGRQRSTASSVICSTSVSMASIARSFNMRNIRAETPSVTCRIFRKVHAVNRLGLHKGRFLRIKATRVSNSSFAAQRCS